MSWLAGGLYPLELEFSQEYPAHPPIARFPAGFFHPNVYDNGKVCCGPPLTTSAPFKLSLLFVLHQRSLLPRPEATSKAEISGCFAGLPQHPQS